MARAYRFFLVLSLLLVSAACYETERYSHPRPLIGAPTDLAPQEAPEPGNVPAQEPGRTQRMPWELFAFGRDLNGRPFQNVHLRRGDEYLEQGMRRQAAAQYALARKIPISPPEQEALALRVASSELALDHAKESLASLSRYFVSAGRSVEDVNPQFSLLFAFAYGRAGNIDQALAWFSRSYRTAGGQGGVAQAAETGVDLLLRSLSEPALSGLSPVWSSDAFINGAIGREAERRARGVQVQPASCGQSPAASAPLPSSGQAAPASIAVLVPLSGQYRALGESTRNGIALALEGRPNPIAPVFMDDKGEAVEATVQMQGIAQRRDVAAVIGPLLTAPALAAADVARQEGIPLIALAKKSEFPTSEEVFRLGPTTLAQVVSLLEACYRGLGLVRYAMVYPQTESGIEYATAFRQVAQQMGLELLYEGVYQSPDAASFIKIGEELDALRSEAVFFPGDLDAAALLLQSVSDQLRSRIRLLGTASWDDRTKFARSRGLLQRAVFVTPFFAESDDSLVQRFVDGYRARYHTTPDFMAAQGFDAATIAATAIDRQRADGGTIAQAIRSMDVYDGVTGRIKPGFQGELERRFAVVEEKDGRLVRIVVQSGSPTYSARGNDVQR